MKQDPLTMDPKQFENWSMEDTALPDEVRRPWWDPGEAFDRARFDEYKFCCVYNVLVVESIGGVVSRIGIGTVHIDAFHQASLEEKMVVLG